jgi:hypothetical protein
MPTLATSIHRKLDVRLRMKNEVAQLGRSVGFCCDDAHNDDDDDDEKRQQSSAVVFVATHPATSS